MKSTVSLLLIAVALFAVSCGPKTSNTVIPMVYSVNGISDVTVRQYQDTSFVLVTNSLYDSGPQEVAELKITTLPAGVTVSPTSSSGTPTFGSVFTFHAVTTTAGSFPITLTATSPTSGTKTYTFNLIVTASAPMAYSLSSLPNITVPQYTYNVAIPVTATYGSGPHEALTFTGTGGPSGTTFDSASYTGIPTFSRTINMRGPFNVTGTYPVNINASSTSTGTQVHSFNVTVTTSSDCSVAIGSASPGSAYTTNTTCTSYSGTGTGISTGNITVTGTNQVSMHTPFINLTGHLNCSAGTFTTDATANADFSVVAGSGTFTSNVVVVNYNLSGSITSGCTTTFTR